MKGSQYWDYLNDQISKAVQGTLNQENIKDLNDKITKTVNSALAEAREQVQKATDEFRHTGQSFQDSKPPRTVAPEKKVVAPVQRNPAAKMKPVGGVAGILYMVFGGIGLGAALLLVLVTLFINLLGFFYLPTGFILGTGVVAAAFFLMIRRGAGKRKRLKRAEQYVKLCGNRNYVNIKELAQVTGRSVRYILKDIKRMIKLGIYPEGHIDQQNTCLMLNQNIYNQYLSLEEERKVREAEEQAAKKQPREAVSGQAGAESHEELDSLAAQGKAYIRQLRELNDEIEGEIISTKLFCMENLLEEMFYRVGTHPEQIPKIQRLMEYYLPMTIKLVLAYRDFDRISIPDQEILSAKAEIEKTLDTINHAFGEILNSLYRDAALDVTTDAQVLQSMMAREGLTNELY